VPLDVEFAIKIPPPNPTARMAKVVPTPAKKIRADEAMVKISQFLRTNAGISA
jgi:hypothetical protein